MPTQTARTNPTPTKRPETKPAATPEPTKSESTEKDTVTRARINYDVAPVSVEPVTDDNPFSRGAVKTIEDDHPLMKVYNVSLEKSAPLKITTDDPRSTVAVLRRIATQKKNGIRFDAATREHLKDPENHAYPGHVIFKVNPKRAENRGRKAKTEE